MNINEGRMKSRGEEKVWKSIESVSGAKKKIASTQIGQQLLLDESLRIFEDVKDWVVNKTAKAYRKKFTDYFSDDDILLQKIVETMLVLSGDIESACSDSGPSTMGRSRRKKVQVVRDRVLPDLDFENAFRFLEVVVDYSEYFEVDKVLNKGRDSWRWSIKYRCTLSKTIVAKLSLEAAVAFYPLAMTEPPKRWKWDSEANELIGGYNHFQYPLVRSNHFDIDYSKFSEGIFNRANYIQQTPWIVNEEVLAQLTKDVKLPKSSDYLKMEYPDISTSRWDIDIKSEDLEMSDSEIDELKAVRLDFQSKVSLYEAERGDYESAVGKYRAIKLAMQIAERYIGETIYFPHNYDFRGRIYPISIGLSPQGSDGVKALLLYKNTEELTDLGISWNWSYLASLYGDDKLPFDQRIERGKELLNVSYKDADEPYQFLSHQIELQTWVNDKNYVPNTRVHLDACNSGSQFTSAITGDIAGCKATNVLPTYDKNGEITRQDAYMLVAKKSIEKTKQLVDSADEDVDVYAFLLGLLESDGRKICKTPTMVSNYGGTSAGRAKILWEMFRELGCEKKWITKKNSHIFSVLIGDSIHGTLNGGKAFEVYIQQMSNCISRGNNPVTWDTRDGFHVIHRKNKELKSKQIMCTLPGSRKSTKITKKIYSKDLSGPKMRSAISPNYIHALDAELLRETSRRMEEDGIENSDWIHDSFGCHPNHVDKMLQFAKEEFVNLIKKDPLKTLDVDLRSQVSQDPKHQASMNKIIMPVFDESIVGGCIEKLMDSDWFFS